jgi:protein disulfide-isomerase A6
LYFYWIQGGDFFELEDKLNLGFGFPAVVAINNSKKKFSTMRSSFDKDNIKSFVSNLLVGKEALKNLPALPNLKTVEAWNEDASGKSEEL